MPDTLLRIAVREFSGFENALAEPSGEGSRRSKIDRTLVRTLTGAELD